jgi:hypothetical protein
MLELLIGGIYELCRCNGLRCHDIYTKFQKDWFKHLKANWGGGGGDTNGDTNTHTSKFS